MSQLLSVQSIDDILPEYRQTPIGLLLEFHNLNRPVTIYDKAQLLIGMCMDNRKHLHIPDNFAFIIRAGGANLRYSEFKVRWANQAHCTYRARQLWNGKFSCTQRGVY